MINLKTITALLSGAALATAQCTFPTEPLSNNITYYFRAQVQNATRLEVHNKYMNFLEAGGGDKHLFIGPVGEPTYDLTLINGVIHQLSTGVRAVIGGEWSEIDHTTKLFTTGRGDPAAVFEPEYACNPDTGLAQIELRFVRWVGEPDGGFVCVRHSFDGSHEFRYDPPGNTLIDVNRECIRVTLVVIPSDGIPPPPPTTLSTVVTSTTTSASVSVPPATTTSTTAPTSTATGLPYTDQTANGWRFIGCAPEERWTTDGAFRTLSGAMTSSDTMTNAACMAFCEAGGFAYGGTEWSRECWCGNSYAPTRQPATTLASLAACNYRCTGNNAEYCGGDAWLSLYAKCPATGPCENAVFT